MLCAAAAAAHGVEVKQVTWGFDGRAVPERVNLLSVLLDNPSARPVNAEAAVYLGDLAGGRAGARIEQPLYLAPFASRWVQFRVYVGQMGQRWVLDTGDRTHRLDPPLLGPPARVYLLEPDALSGRVPNLKTFPDELFPTSVAATDGLASVVLDHAPRWEALRRQALLDWLRRGGIVHLVRGPDGRLPAFNAELSVLNGSDTRSRVGAGLVVRHAPDEPRLSDGVLADEGFPPLTLGRGGRVYLGNMDSAILQELRRLVQPKRSWLLMYLALLVYAALVVPVNWLVSRRRRSYLLPLAFFLACVAGATVALSYIGQRGYGERQRQLSVAVARQLEDGVYDVTHWTNVFVTRGGNYDLSYGGDYGIYTTGDSNERAAAVVRSGVQGRMLADMPLYTSRTFMHRGKMEGPALGVRLEEFQGGERLSRLVCSVGPQFPGGFVEACAFYRGRFYTMWRDGDRWQLVGGPGLPLDDYLSQGSLHFRGWSPYAAYGGAQSDADPGEVLPTMRPALIAHCLGGTQDYIYHVEGGPPDDGRVRLFIFAPATGQLAEGPLGGRQLAYVLYSLDLFPSEATDE